MWVPKPLVARGRDVGLAQPLLTITRHPCGKILSGCISCVNHTARIVIVGLPMMLDGTEGRSARLARQLERHLRHWGIMKSTIKMS